MNTPQPHSTAPLDFPRLDLGDDRHRRFEVIHGRRETLVKVHGDAMAQLNAEASSMSLDGADEQRRLAVLHAPGRQSQAAREEQARMDRARAINAAAEAARRWQRHEQRMRAAAAHRAARQAVEQFTGHARIPRRGPVRIAARARRDRLWTLALASAALSCLGLLATLAWVATR